MKITFKKIKVLQFQNDCLYYILQNLQTTMLHLLNTPTVHLYWFKLTGIDDAKVGKKLPEVSVSIFWEK